MRRTAEVFLLSLDDGATWDYYSVVIRVGRLFIVSHLGGKDRELKLQFLNDADILHFIGGKTLCASMDGQNALVKDRSRPLLAETHLLFKKPDIETWVPCIVTTPGQINVIVVGSRFSSLNIAEDEVAKLLAGEEATAALNWDVVRIKKDPLFG